MPTSPVLSVQLYSLRNHGPLESQLDLVRAAGFGAVETIERLMEDAQATRGLLDARGLTARSGHVSLPAMRDRPDWAIDAARVLGLETLIVPALHPPFRPTDAEGWRAVGAELGRMARRVAGREPPLRLPQPRLGGAAAPRRQPAARPPARAGAAEGLGWQADLAWLVRGGDDPLARLERHADRVTSVHVKDLAPAGENEDEDGWADVGHGTMDWAKLWQRSAAAGCTLLIAEHDKPSDAARFCRRSFAAMQQLAGAA